ncbi:DUF7533 family protein [Halonotius roseus]|uniref:Uncharacterized protein n=1 Tax=Halonotius roseus TaxID=2511997 RepID=A0A544QS67_9EURY|nr:hypothetical protein [Halonotius roseus]TQQ82290.1 hypothetical protein EWF95_05015 [Halonotius roseus]
MQLGIVDLIGLATTLVFAIPVANFGVTQLLAGKPVGGVALLGVAVAMVVLPQYFLDPKRILGRLLRGLLPARLRETSKRNEPPK